MASLKCNHCGFGIHYHDAPNGIEYEAYSQEMWDSFSRVNLPIISFTDESDDFLIVWRCPECGCVHTFDGYGASLKQAYVPFVGDVDLTNARKYLVFVDYLRDEVYEQHWNVHEFMKSGKRPNDRFFYAKVGNEGIVVYEDAVHSTPLRKYAALKAAAKNKGN